jgi:glycosyltransferase involved in cell wall biosynthesis
MKVSGFTFVRNAVKYDFPMTEAIRSILPIVDEFVVNVGDSEDDTLGLIRSIGDPKVRTIENVWDDSKRKDGEIFREQTNLALDECKGDWAFYLQADEVVHEEELPRLRTLMEENLDRPMILGLRFRYLHFYGDYRTLNPWFYRKEIRVIRNNGKVRSIGDAVGFYCTDDPAVKNLKDGPPERFVVTGCHIYHYGWVKNPRTMLEKKIFQESRHQGTDSEAVRRLAAQKEWRFENFDIMKDFGGTHPAVMRERVANFLPFLERESRWRNLRFYAYVLRHGFKG